MSILSTVIGRGSHASRPAAGNAGSLYYETDTFNMFRDNGSTWDLVSIADIITTKGDLILGSAADVPARLGVGSDGQVLTADSGSTNGIKWATPSGSGAGYIGYIHVRDQQTANTEGGTSTSGSWQTRVLNTEVLDTNNDCSLASNQITLSAGTYDCICRQSLVQCGRGKGRLRNVTDSSTVLVGTSEYSAETESGGHATIQSVTSLIVGRFTIGASKALEVQYQVGSGRATNGLGVASNYAEVEVYTTIELWRVS